MHGCNMENVPAGSTKVKRVFLLKKTPEIPEKTINAKIYFKNVNYFTTQL